MARLSELDRRTVALARRLRLSRKDIAAFVKAAAMDDLQSAPWPPPGSTASAGRVGAAIAGSFRDAIREGRDLVSTLRDIALRLSDIALSAAFKPVERFPGSLFDNLFTGLIGGFSLSANGNVFDHGDIMPFASGGLVTRPTLFPMARGGLGLMGEAGPEAILPLKRDGRGRLGVIAGGGGAPVSITFNVTTPDVESFRRSGGQITAMLTRAVARGRRGL